jgi:peptidoglycan/xylan/chitin deacetylase (PgdA/CDA1 family)
MEHLSRSTKSAHRRAAVAAALGIAIVALAGACGGTSSGAGGPLSVPPTPAVSLATPSVIGPSATPATSPTPGPAVSVAPATATPAPSYALVNSCNPKTVPAAIPVAAASGRASSFTLHVPIIEYHRIVPHALAGNSLPSLVVAPETFAAHLDALQQAGWHTITMATLANDLLGHVKPPAKTFVITIDDGWYDGYTYALPILEQHGFVATFYVIAGRIDRPNSLTSAQLQALVAAGEDIGDHTWNHVELSSQRSAALTYEIDAAAARIAQVTGRWPESLAYPYGGADQRAANAVAACQEMRIAVIEQTAADKKLHKPVALETWTNHFDVPRVELSPSTKPANLVAELTSLSAG